MVYINTPFAFKKRLIRVHLTIFSAGMEAEIREISCYQDFGALPPPRQITQSVRRY
jgi:hypothetical protein